ncbi:hypothetical protein ACFP3I_16565 [Chryseobacterium arachidis]
MTCYLLFRFSSRVLRHSFGKSIFFPKPIRRSSEEDPKKVVFKQKKKLQ